MPTAKLQSLKLQSLLTTCSARLAVIGQGYVGLTLALGAARAGYPTSGFDVDAERVADLAAGRCTVAGVEQRDLDRALATGRLRFTSDLACLDEADVVVICVPTPLQDQAPDLSYVRTAATATARHLAPGQLVILESTTYPGTTDELVRPILETSGLVCGRDFLLAYSPERIDPGNAEFGLANTPKVVGGITPAATEAACLLYSQFTEKVVPVSSTRAAELTKLLENTFRHVNIALINEMATFCHDLDIDIWEVIDAAATKPFGFMPFYPGPGVGGHCIPLDPAYLAWQVRRRSGSQFRILEEAQDINAHMPGYVAGRIADDLNVAGKAVNGARILILGVTYKPNVADLRESPALAVAGHLDRRGAKLAYHDPYIKQLTLPAGRTLSCSPLTTDELAAADLVALLTPHSGYDLDEIAARAAHVFDARNAFPSNHGNVTRL
jgi:UDP-N-acetyl-D-glucosamine dehydrogenase